MEHPNAELMRRAGELLGVGDFAAFLALHTEDVVMHIPGSGPMAGDHQGRDGIAAVFQQELSLLDEPPTFEAIDDLGSDRHAASLIVQRLRRGGRDLASRQTIVARVEDGKLAEVWFLPEDQARWDEFFA